MPLSKIQGIEGQVTPNLGRRNIVHNGAMQVDQRHSNASFTVVNGNALTGYIADRFRFNDTSGAAFTGQTVSDAPVGFEYSSKVTVTTADASLGSTEFHRIIQGIEGKDIGHLNWGSANAKTLTLSFYVKSSVAGQYYVSVFNSAANRTLLKGYTISSANTWEKKTITIIGDQSGTWLTTNGCGIYLMWSLGTGASYQSNTLDAYQGAFAMAKSDQVNIAATNGSTFQLTGVQLEVGSVATDFEHRSYGDELLACERYYQVLVRHGDGSGGTNSALGGSSLMYSSSYLSVTVTFRTHMRAPPTLISANSTGCFKLYRSNGNDVFDDFTAAGARTPYAMEMYNTSDVSGTQGDGGFVETVNSNATLSIESEL